MYDDHSTAQIPYQESDDSLWTSMSSKEIQLLFFCFFLFSCQGCEIEFSKSKSPLVKIDDIADMDGEFYVHWAHLVKNPLCVARVEVKVDNRTRIDKSCDCASAPPESQALKSYLGKILISQPPVTSCWVCRVTNIEVRLTNSEEKVLTIRKTIDPVKDLFDSSKNIKTTLSKEGIAVHWIEGGMFLSDRFREKCLKSVDVYNQGFLLMKKVTPDNPIIPMEPCSKTKLTFKYNFRQNSRKQELFLYLNSSSHCESDETTIEMIEVATLGIDVLTKSGEESQTLDIENATLKDTTPSITSNSDSPSHNEREKARTLLDETEEESSGTIMIGSATSAVAILALVVVLVLVVTRKSRTNPRQKQVQQAIIYKVKDTNFVLQSRAGKMFVTYYNTNSLFQVVLRPGMDENPLYGHLRNSDVAEIREVNDLYAAPSDP